MGVIENSESYETVRVRFEAEICYLQIYRPAANNCINERLIGECTRVLERCEAQTTIVVLEGLPDVFCFGADMEGIRSDWESKADFQPMDPAPLYDLWRRLACGPYVTVAHVRGKANAGGVGFFAACDIVLCEDKSVFSLSELLFGLMPACVSPFLIRRMGFSRAHYMTLMTQPVSARQAQAWGLVDFCAEDSEDLLRRHLVRLRQLRKTAVARYKRYMSGLDGSILSARPSALAANKEVFSDVENLRGIERYLRTGTLPGR